MQSHWIHRISNNVGVFPPGHPLPDLPKPPHQNPPPLPLSLPVMVFHHLQQPLRLPTPHPPPPSPKQLLNVHTHQKNEEFSFYLDQETQITETQNQETQNQENPNQENQNQENENQENPNQENQNQENQNQENLDTLGVPDQIIYRPTGFNQVIGVENGLILLIEDFSHYSNPDPYLWNPAVNVFVKLPSPEIERECPDMYAFGFWFDSRNCDFKVMRIVYRSNKEVEAGYDLPPLAEVYSLNTGEWGRVNVDGVECYMPVRSWSCVNLNGRLHWIGYKYDPLLSLIVSFDVNDGVCGEIMLPIYLLTMIAFDLKVTDTMGCLAVIGDDRRRGFCRIWVMKKYGDLSSWTNLCNISIHTGPTYYRFLWFWKNDDVLLIRDSCQLVRYVPGSQSLVDLDIVLGGLSACWAYAGKYEESLALLDFEFSDEWVVDGGRE